MLWRALGVFGCVLYVLYNVARAWGVARDALCSPRQEQGEGTLRSFLLALFLGLPIDMFWICTILVVQYYGRERKDVW